MTSCQKKDLDGGTIKGNSVSIIENAELVFKEDVLFSTQAAGTTVTIAFFVAGDEGRDINYYVEKNDWCQIRSESSWPYERKSFQLKDGEKRTIEGYIVTISFIVSQNKSNKSRECVFHLLSCPSGSFQHESEIKIVQEGK